MLFTLEALRAKHGDSLLLHYGQNTAKRKLIVIDGGPSGVYTQALRPRLKQLQQAWAQDTGKTTLPVRLAMVSHIDDDHINGMVQWLTDLASISPKIDCTVDELWHNSFDDIIGSPQEADALRSSLNTAVTASLGGGGASALPLQFHAAQVLASVKQGRDLRLLATSAGISMNAGFPHGFIVVREKKKAERKKFGPLTLSVLGPRLDRVKALQEEWKKQVKKLGFAERAAFTDQSVFNLSSLIVLATAGGMTMLLTGDARGDDIITSLRSAKLLKADGSFTCDLLKIPHHGSDHNVSTEFFRQVRADHYVFSGDGKHHNPELATLGMLLEARGGSPFHIHLTYDESRVRTFLKSKKAAQRGALVHTAPAAGLGLQVDLGSPLTI